MAYFRFCANSLLIFSHWQVKSGSYSWHQVALIISPQYEFVNFESFIFWLFYFFTVWKHIYTVCAPQHNRGQNISGVRLPAFCLNIWGFITFSKLLNFIWTSWIALLLLFTNSSSFTDVHYSFYVCLNFFKISHLVTLPLDSKATAWMAFKICGCVQLVRVLQKKRHLFYSKLLSVTKCTDTVSYPNCNF